MSYQVNPVEFARVTALSPSARMSYFIGKVADWEEVWSTAKEHGWSLMATDNGEEVFPLWPANAFASAYCVNDWSDHVPRSIALDEFLSKWLPGMHSESRRIAIFPISENKGIVVTADELKAFLTEALEVYE